MVWNVERGFLPSTDPVEVLSVSGEVYRPLVNLVESLAGNLVPVLQDYTVRGKIVCKLREVVPFFDHDLFNSFGSDTMDERAFLVYGYFAASYINNHGEKPLHRLAKEITIPIVRLAERVQRKPVLDYYSYIMYNWRRKKSTGSLTVDNLETLLTFTDTDEEKAYIVSRVAVEALAEPIVKSRSLTTLSEQLTKMLGILKASPTLPKSVESYFQSFVNVKYEGWGWLDPQNYNGEVATQSTLISFISRLLGVPYREDDLRDYKPHLHRNFLDGVSSLRDGKEKSCYNECLVKFADLVDLLSSPQSNLMWNRFGGNKGWIVANHSLGENP